MSRLDEHRIAALLSEASEPRDPVVPPGRDFTRRAHRRLMWGWVRSGAAALAMVATVGGGGFWIAWQGAADLPPPATRQMLQVSGLDDRGPGEAQAPVVGPRPEQPERSTPLEPPESPLPWGTSDVAVAPVPVPAAELLTRLQHQLAPQLEGTDPVGQERTDQNAAEARQVEVACRYSRTRCEQPRDDMQLPFVDGQVTALTAEEYLQSLEWLWAMPRASLSGSGGGVVGDSSDGSLPPSWQTGAAEGANTTVDAAEWSAVMVDCLHQQGHGAQVVSGLPWLSASERTPELAPDARACALAHQPPWAWQQLDPQQWRQVHVHLQQHWLTCLGPPAGDAELIAPEQLIAGAAAGRPISEPLLTWDSASASASVSVAARACQVQPDDVADVFADID